MLNISNRFTWKGNPFKRALMLRLALAMGSIVGLAFAGMLASVFIAGTTQGQGTAINQAGSLRMQAYRINANLIAHRENETQLDVRLPVLVQEFAERLTSRRLLHILPTNEESELRQAYDDIYQSWQQEISPLLNGYAQALATGNIKNPKELHEDISQKYNAFISDFVYRIDHLVALLEYDVETKLQMLTLIQGIILFLTVIIVSITMFMMQSEVQTRLQDLVRCAEHARRRDFSVRPNFKGEDELGRLAYAFDFMAEDLAKLYDDLEERVKLKTRDLERSNKSIQLLYNTTRRLSGSPLVSIENEEILKDIETYAQTGPGMICLTNKHLENAKNQALRYSHADWLTNLCNAKDCLECEQNSSVQVLKAKNGCALPKEVTAFQIADRDTQHGILFITGKEGKPLVKWQIELIEVVAQTIGTALGVADKIVENRRLTLLEERSVIARELHDSLAQSLAYIKIQVSRLQKNLVMEKSQEEVNAIALDIRAGVSKSYKHLRELLTTFRLNIDGLDINHALNITVKEFVERYGLKINLNNSLPNRQLSPNEEVHILQIIREALSNVAHHAHAEHVDVNLYKDVDQTVCMTVSDNGIGLPVNRERLDHYGLAIMEERTRSLNGTITMTNRPCGGTCIEVKFVPQSNQGNPSKINVVHMSEI